MAEPPARCRDALARLAALILRLQRELFVAGAELAANPDAATGCGTA